MESSLSTFAVHGLELMQCNLLGNASRRFRVQQEHTETWTDQA